MRFAIDEMHDQRCFQRIEQKAIEFLFLLLFLRGIFCKTWVRLWPEYASAYAYAQRRRGCVGNPTHVLARLSTKMKAAVVSWEYACLSAERVGAEGSRLSRR